MLRGLAAAAAKSVELLSVSVQPLPFRISALVVLGAGATAVSKQVAVLPYPIKSTIVAPEGQAPLSAVVLLTSATLPAVAAMAIVPGASAAGILFTPFAPAPSPTR